MGANCLKKIRENDLALLTPRLFEPLVRIAKVDYGPHYKPLRYFVRSLNAPATSEPVAISANQVIQIFSGVL